MQPGPPTSWQTRAAALTWRPQLCGLARQPSCAQAERWSPYTSKRPPQGQHGAALWGRAAGASGVCQYTPSGTWLAVLVGKAVKDREGAARRIASLNVVEERLEHARGFRCRALPARLFGFLAWSRSRCSRGRCCGICLQQSRAG